MQRPPEQWQSAMFVWAPERYPEKYASLRASQIGACLHNQLFHSKLDRARISSERGRRGDEPVRTDVATSLRPRPLVAGCVAC